MIMWWRQEGAAANGHKRNRQGPGNMRLDKAENQTDVNSSKARQGERYEMGNRGFDTLGEQQDDRAEVAACIRHCFKFPAHQGTSSAQIQPPRLTIYHVIEEPTLHCS